MPTPTFLPRRAAVSLGLLLLLLATTSPASAITVRAAGLPELIEGSELIVEGQVVAVRSVALDMAPGLFTDYAIAVHTVHKGSPSDRVWVRVPGGKGEEHTVVVEGMPTLKLHSSVLLMLEAQPSSVWMDATTPSYLPLGLHQGMFERSADGTRFIRGEAGAQLVYIVPECTGGEHLTQFDADTLRTNIRQTLKHAEAREREEAAP